MLGGRSRAGLGRRTAPSAPATTTDGRFYVIRVSLIRTGPVRGGGARSRLVDQSRDRRGAADLLDPHQALLTDAVVASLTEMM